MFFADLHLFIIVVGKTQGTERQRLAHEPTEHQEQNQARICLLKVQLSFSPSVSLLRHLPMFIKCLLFAKLCARH